MTNTITGKLFAALNILVLKRVDAGCFQILENMPSWLNNFCVRKVRPGMKILIPEEQFPFIENFLFDAEAFWENNLENQQKKPLKSGLWTDYDLRGQEYHFEASAVCLNDEKILLVECLEEDYEEKRNLIQKARENSLTYEYLLKENQKKDVLIHCIIHDIAGQLSGINCCFALLELENLTPKGKERLQIGRKQSIKQEILIREILDAFSTEVKSLENFQVEPFSAPDVLTSAQEVIQLLTPSFALGKVELKLADYVDTALDWKVIGDKSRLDRVLSNLTENALRYSPAESTVAIGLQQDGDYILVSVEDAGEGVAPELENNLFEKFSQGKGKSGRAGLGLYFCRITIQRWGGTIGYSSRPEGGSRFWFRLPKPGSIDG
jgi:signal transduction histidine kinase